jgi:cytochrome c oxidase subunit I+III
VMLASVSLNLQVHDTMFVVAHLHYVLIGGAVFPLFGAFHYWYPKWTGRMMSERLGHVSFWLLFVGFNLTFFPLHRVGLAGMPRRVYTYLPETGWGFLNHLASSGAALMFLGVLALLINLIRSLRLGEVAGSDPWGANTLEWSTPSPPPLHGWVHPPAVRSRDPLWDRSGDAPAVTGLSSDKREVLVTTTLDAVPDHRYVMTGDSITPILTAAFVAYAWIGGMFHPVNLPIAAGLVTLALYKWFWESGERKPAA